MLTEKISKISTPLVVTVMLNNILNARYTGNDAGGNKGTHLRRRDGVNSVTTSVMSTGSNILPTNTTATNIQKILAGSDAASNVGLDDNKQINFSDKEKFSDTASKLFELLEKHPNMCTDLKHVLKQIEQTPASFVEQWKKAGKPNNFEKLFDELDPNTLPEEENKLFNHIKGVLANNSKPLSNNFQNNLEKQPTQIDQEKFSGFCSSFSSFVGEELAMQGRPVEKIKQWTDRLNKQCDKVLAKEILTRNTENVRAK